MKRITCVAAIALTTLTSVSAQTNVVFDSLTGFDLSNGIFDYFSPVPEHITLSPSTTARVFDSYNTVIHNFDTSSVQTFALNFQIYDEPNSLIPLVSFFSDLFTLNPDEGREVGVPISGTFTLPESFHYMISAVDGSHQPVESEEIFIGLSEQSPTVGSSDGFGGYYSALRINASPSVPEPGTFVLSAAALGMILGISRRK